MSDSLKKEVNNVSNVCQNVNHVLMELLVILVSLLYPKDNYPIVIVERDMLMMLTPLLIK
jgi:hypothetical protein